jgi:hypothetical protein
VWSKVDATGTKVFATTPGFGAPGGGFFFQETGPTCCEHAFARAGLSSAGNCGGFQTSTGQVVLFTANGVVAGGTQPIVLEDLIIPPSGAVTTGEAKQIGCFKDPNNPFDLDGFLERSGSNTPQHCVETCRTKGFAYAGVQYGESCLCGNAYGRFGAADNCNMACTGDSSQTCGGINSNMVYSTGLPVAGTGSGGGGAACHDRCQPVAPCPSGEVPLCKDQCGLSRVCRFEPGADRCAICEPQ